MKCINIWNDSILDVIVSWETLTRENRESTEL